MAIDIALAAEADAAPIAALLAEAFAVYEPRYTPEAFAATIASEDVVRARMAEGPVWVARDGSLVVGSLSAVIREGGLYLRGMAVLPVSRGTGGATGLLTAAVLFAGQHRCDRLFLSTTPFLDRAIRFYERAGFARTDAPPHDLHGTPLFTMERTLE